VPARTEKAHALLILPSWAALWCGILALCGAGCLMMPRTAEAQAYPRLANMYLHGSVDPAEIPELARWDMLILDTAWTQTDLQALRALNPDIQLYLYVCSYCVETSPSASDPWTQNVRDYAQANDLWWYDRSSRVATDWPGSAMANITERGYAGPQGTWREFMTDQIVGLITARPAVDGVFLDNYWKGMSWNQGLLQLDSDCNPTHNPAGCDGVMDTNAALDSIWNRALRTMAVDLRSRFDQLEVQRGRPLAIHSNRASDYFSSLNGTLYEFFPSGWSNVDPGNPYGYNWNQEMFAAPGGYLMGDFSTDPMFVSVLNADWTSSGGQPVRSLEFERHKRFTFVSALLGDGFYSLDSGDQTGHGSIWWEPEYDNDGRGTGYLGQALGAMQRIIVATGPEKIINGDFTSQLDGWQSQPFLGTGSATWDTSDAHSAPGSVRLQVTSLNDPNANYKLWQSPVSVEQGKGYTLRFWARAEPPQDLLLHLYSNDCPSLRCLGDKTVPLTSTWEEHVISFQPSGTSMAAGLNLFATTVGQMWLDDISLREGDSSVYRRDFENGIVLLNYTAEPITVDLQGNHQRLDIAASTVFDGAFVTQETVPSWDARILLNVASGGGPTSGPVPPPADAGRLDQNTPNPFNPGTQIRFELAQQEKVELAVFDIAGRRVRTLVDRVLQAGVEHSVTWNGRDEFDRSVPSGIYIYRLQTPSMIEQRKMTLLR